MTPLVQTVTDILSLGTVLADALVIFLLVIFLTPIGEKGRGKKIVRFFGDHAIFWSFLVAGGSVVGSLFYSEFAHFAPCELCWIQRAFLYTEAVILFIALVARKAERVRAYNAVIRQIVLWLAVIQIPVSAYHTYLQLGGASLVPCSATGPSCSFVYFVEYGYVTIPSMALTAAALIVMFMLFSMLEEAEE